MFTINTTSHMNAAPYQDSELHNWLISKLTEIARQSKDPKDQNEQGRSVSVIVEIL